MARKHKKTTRRANKISVRTTISSTSKKTGRPRDIKIEDLPERYHKIKSFLEHHWGVFSLDLKQLHDPNEVRPIFERIQGVEWMGPFREDVHARCLISEKGLAATSKEIRATRRKLKSAKSEENDLWFEYNNTHPRAREASDALKQAISTFQYALDLFPFFLVIAIVAKQLRVEELTQLSSELEKEAREATAQNAILKEKLSAYEADFAKKELVRFVNENDREDRTLINFARVIAGLPEWRWLHSVRECKKLGLGTSKPESAYQIFLRLKTIVRRMKPPKLENIERRLREQLLSPDCDPMLRDYADMHWSDLYVAIYSCANVARQELPDRIMGNFVMNLQRPKDSIDTSLAKNNRLVLNPKV
jgi:hypothetical protein